jgi:predicted kinase
MTPHDTHQPVLVVVSGRPGAGKSTLARRLAGALAWPLVSRDEIKEGIARTVRDVPELATKERVTKLAFDTFFDVLRVMVFADVSFVAEAAFQDWRWRLGLEPLLPRADLRIVQCVVEPEVAVQRIARRRLEKQQHGGGPDVGPPGRSPAHQAVQPVSSFEPLSLPVPSLDVVTADGYHPGFDEILAFVTSS